MEHYQDIQTFLDFLEQQVDEIEDISKRRAQDCVAQDSLHYFRGQNQIASEIALYIKTYRATSGEVT